MSPGPSRPSTGALLRKAHRIVDGVGLLYQRGAPAVLELVPAVRLHEVVAQAVEIDPRVRHLVNEEGGGHTGNRCRRLASTHTTGSWPRSCPAKRGKWASRWQVSTGSGLRHSRPSATAKSRMPASSHGRSGSSRPATIPS
jgi:hypothetical protein